MGLSLARRPVLLGNTISINTQHHGDANVAALYIPFRRMTLTPEELVEITLEERAYKLLYRKVKGRPDEPIWGKIAPTLPLRSKITDVRATLFLGRRQLKVIDATITRGVLEWQSGGNTWFHGQLQCVPDLDEDHPIITSLVSRVNETIDLEIDCEGYGSQQELELEEHVDDEGEAGKEETGGTAESDEDDEELSTTGKKIAAAMRKPRGGPRGEG